MNSSTYVYLQPIWISLLSEGSRIGTVFKGDNHLQVDVPVFISSNGDRPPLKLRDLIKINKEYKVYNSVINFYNFLYELQIKTSAIHKLNHEIIKIRLQSKKAKGNRNIRSYYVEVNTLLEDSESNDISVSRKRVVEDGGQGESEFVFNVVASSGPLSLVSLEQILENQRSSVMYNSRSREEQTEELGLTEKQVPSKYEILSTLGSEDWGNGQTGVSRTTNTSQPSGIKPPKKSIRNEELAKLQELNFLKVEEAGDCSMRKSRAEEDGVQNTNFYDESPKFKRLYRLRRSCVIPSSVHCEMDEIDPQQSFFKTKKRYVNAFHYFLIVLGLGVIYLLMHPSRRV